MSLRRAGLENVGTTGLLLLINLATGLATSRLLGPSGRGELAAILVVTQTLVYASALGLFESVTYHRSRQPGRAGELRTVAFLLGVVLPVAGLCVGEALLPVLFSRQPPELLAFMRLYLPVMVLMTLGGVCVALLSGGMDFRGVNLCRGAQPVLYGAALVVLALLGRLTAYTLALATAGISLVVLVLAARRIPNVLKFERLDWQLLRSVIVYGSKLVGSLFSSLTSARLDIIVMPRYLTTTEIGYYYVSVTVSGIIVTLFASISIVLLPVLARVPTNSATADTADSAARVLRLTLLAATAVALVAAGTARFLVPFGFGAPFKASVVPLYLLLPGAVSLCGLAVMSATLQAIGRPGSESLAQGFGSTVTVIGLFLVLPAFGIRGAAALSSVAYTCSFVVSLVIVKRRTGSSWRVWFDWSLVGADILETVRARGRSGS